MRIIAVSLFVLLVAGCTQSFFHPDRLLVATPDQSGVDYSPVVLTADDGTQLFAWFLPARGAASGTVLYLHGNAQNISAYFPSVAWLPAAGFNVLMLDYRGYGRSGGEPSLPGLQHDIDTAMRALLAKPGVDPHRIFVFGQSLGAALAIHYAAHSSLRSNIRAVIADSSFADYRAISREKLASTPFTWPLQWLPALTVNNDYSPQAAVAAVSPIPILFIHGADDGVVPPRHSQLLFQRASEPKDLWLVPHAGHIQAVRSSAIQNRLVDFLRQHSGERLAGGSL